ncbi:hypothetical protein Hypma_007742 [Hypsizygus marmoreus]|uniref:Uncharacterized protein n=1 Tax=Hypsizygus marmoreus TaxID=39966 RepID=A0A369JV82_HYPMA|nr:hypothetical protein Hypma_007742 [Hypsizygus marmoreus]
MNSIFTTKEAAVSDSPTLPASFAARSTFSIITALSVLLRISPSTAPNFMPLSPIGPSPPAFIVLVAPALPSRRNQIHPQISIHLPISSRFTNGTPQPENIEIASVHNPCLRTPSTLSHHVRSSSHNAALIHNGDGIDLDVECTLPVPGPRVTVRKSPM